MMSRTLTAGALALGLTALIGLAAAPAAAQSGAAEIEALKDEVEALRDGQATIQKSLEEILSILEPLKRRTQAQKFTPRDIELAGAASRGAAEAPVTLVEFTDYQCPFCRRHFFQTLPQIEREFVSSGKLRYVVKEFPIPSLHPDAPKAAEGALCAGEQGAYWAMHDAIFKAPKQVAPEQLADTAAGLGLDAAAFAACLEDGRYAARVRADMAAGRALGVRGTPSFFLGRSDPDAPETLTATKFIRGAQGYGVFKAAIEALLEEPEPGS